MYQELENHMSKKPMQGKENRQLKNSSSSNHTMWKVSQFRTMDIKDKQSIQRKENHTGLSNQLKEGIESLSGMQMDDVRVHFNSSKPSQLNAYAYTKGTDIHVAPGQEKHLAHEAWHVVQQKQGRVLPTSKVNGESINDNVSLEREADAMGAKALHVTSI